MMVKYLYGQVTSQTVHLNTMKTEFYKLVLAIHEWTELPTVHDSYTIIKFTNWFCCLISE